MGIGSLTSLFQEWGQPLESAATQTLGPLNTSSFNHAFAIFILKIPESVPTALGKLQKELVSAGAPAGCSGCAVWGAALSLLAKAGAPLSQTRDPSLSLCVAALG